MLVSLRLRVSLFTVVYLFSFVLSERHGSAGKTLYVAEEGLKKSGPVVINKNVKEPESTHLERRKRDASTSPPAALDKNISTWTTHLNDSHQQLMVHWVGEGSNVIICLARDSSPKNKGALSPSALFISYDYGKNFTNKTELFKLGDKADSGYAQLDKFFNHPKYPQFCVFVDSTNKKLYYTNDNGKTIHRSDLNFSPSELAFDEDLPDKYVILDKVDSNRKLYLTTDGGKTFKHIQSFVKTFFWSSGSDTKAFYVERWKPGGTSTVLMSADPVNLMSATKLFEDAKDFHIKGDYMFATKQSKEGNTLDFYISHLRGPFVKAEFQTELDLKKFHIADVTDKRIFVSVMHTEVLANLYVSEISENFTQYNFVLSLGPILCYFPEGNWKDTWLEDVTEDPFTDLYRVEGLKGIYIASKVDSKTANANVGPEHLVSLITFDHGVTWSPINPPTEDENGKPLNCHIENSCSLHLCQKFSQLYPVTSPPGKVVTNKNERSASIMSSKSAPGIIMATGVMGKSLKGIPGVYMSRDAGLTWKRILKDYYFFNYGDHGGVLVAVKYFKSRGETRKILYSTNEGIEWNSYQFNADDLRIYGLMTEPGENTTTFTMFGSANDQHQWIIITIDLFNTFPRNCTQDDYKFWSPSPPNSTVSCVLGQRDTFQRRLAHTNCYNGISYDRPVKKQACVCGRRDFECDFGFKLSADNECIRNKSVNFDPYAIPPECRPGHFYKRTKGYRKIDGDVCTVSSYLSYAPDMIPCPLEEPQEFLIVALRDKIARIDLSDNSSVIPVEGQKNIVAVEFDIKNNCIYWADIQVDKISRQCFNNGSTQEVIVDTDLASIEGMALDWISNVLFFVDGMRKKIEAVRTDLSSQGRMRATILDYKVLSKPRGIAVHPRAGYLFWTDWDRSNPSVSRSNLDGKDVKKLFGKPIVQWPNGITIDQMAERIYWVDAMEDYIASSDLNGQYFKRILWNDDKVSHPFAVAVLKDKMYWDDWKAKSIFIADKDTGENIITINDSLSGLMDLKVFAHFVQHGSNACSYKNTSCDTLCLGGPGNSFSCLCPDGFTRINGKCMCPNGLEPGADMTCPKTAGGSCSPDQFACKNGMCIASAWHCDGNNDCGDLSDELGCQCTPPMLPCGDSRCYLPHWRCDGDIDCADASDEKDCEHVNCTVNEFQCGTGKCIEKKWVCDGDNDCKDGSDEKNCPSIVPKRPEIDFVNCSANGFACGNDSSAICIPNSWVCDGENDCPGGEDEKDDRCKNSTCAPYMFRCPTGKCIFRSWTCDGENDCGDDEASDEKNCSSTSPSKIIPRPTTDKPTFLNTTCLDWMFKCDNGNCLPYWWRCDAINDCGDNSDEVGCGIYPIDASSISPEHDATKQRCGKNQFQCSPGVCIPLQWVCDTAEDCADGLDEKGCKERPISFHQTCAGDESPCLDGKGCVLTSKLCDGRTDCSDGSDEAACGRSPHKPKADCPQGYFLCDDGTLCVSQAMVCNGQQDCYDGADETNCSSNANDTISFYQFHSIGVDQLSIRPDSFLISCWVAQQKSVQYSYQFSIANATDNKWRNTSWTSDSTYRFTGLQPYTNYNVTFYIQDSKSKKIYASNKYVNVTTGEGVPSPPRRVAVRQLIGSRVAVLWDRPEHPRGVVRSYAVHFTPPVPPEVKVVPVPWTSNSNKTFSLRTTVQGHFEPNKKYAFWVTAQNGASTSESSEVMYLTFDDIGDVDDLANVSMSRLNDSAVYLQWHRIRGIDGYLVNVQLPQGYQREEATVNTSNTNITITDLPTGVQTYVDIIAYKNDIFGNPFTIPLPVVGEKDETLTLQAMLLREKRTSVQLSWSPPTGERYKGKQLEYAVHYDHVKGGLSNRGMPHPTVHILKDTTLTVDGLHACESYLFAVSLRNGPLSKPVEIMTRENAKAPIKDLEVKFDEEHSQLKLDWQANCDLIPEPVTYRLEITEETKNEKNVYRLSPTINTTLSHVINGIPAGARYNICIKADVPDAAVVCARGGGRALPAPRGVVAWQAPNGHLMVSWDTSDDQPTQHSYEVIVSEKEIPADLVHPTADMHTALADSSPVLMTTQGDARPLFVSVRRVTGGGYYGDISEVASLKIEGIGESETTMGAAMWWGAGSAIVVGLLLAAALVHLALRHRRLTRSFLRFTSHTPRYDSRRGQATIGDHDDDDVPPIHGFSDDEPLVIA